MTVTADDLDSVISCVMSGLLPITDRDWSVRAGTLEWDCWHTAEHIGDCLMSFAWQLAHEELSLNLALSVPLLAHDPDLDQQFESWLSRWRDHQHARRMRSPELGTPTAFDVQLGKRFL